MEEKSMISNQILQNTIEGLKSITRIDLGVMDTDGKTLATTFSEPGDYESAVLSLSLIHIQMCIRDRHKHLLQLEKSTIEERIDTVVPQENDGIF